MVPVLMMERNEEVIVNYGDVTTIMSMTMNTAIDMPKKKCFNHVVSGTIPTVKLQFVVRFVIILKHIEYFKPIKPIHNNGNYYSEYIICCMSST
jgi:hypothetical protein